MEGRIKHALKLCGPGAENDKQKDVDPINISRAGMGLPANFGPRPQHIGKLLLQSKSELKTFFEGQILALPGTWRPLLDFESIEETKIFHLVGRLSASNR